MNLKVVTWIQAGRWAKLTHRVHILVEMKQGQCISPLSWSVHYNFTGDGKCNKRGWACTPHPHQPGQILPSSLNVRQKAAVATLCTLWFDLSVASAAPVTLILAKMDRNIYPPTHTVFIHSSVREKCSRFWAGTKFYRSKKVNFL